MRASILGVFTGRINLKLLKSWEMGHNVDLGMTFGTFRPIFEYNLKATNYDPLRNILNSNDFIKMWEGNSTPTNTVLSTQFKHEPPNLSHFRGNMPKMSLNCPNIRISP